MYRIAIPIVLVISLVGFLAWNIPSCQRKRQSIKSNTIGINRQITWTGEGIAPKVWKTKTKVFTDESGKIRFFDENGNIVILMGNVCVEAM